MAPTKVHTHTYTHTPHKLWCSAPSPFPACPAFRFYSFGGDGTPLQYSCLENPMDGGAWWAAVHGVAKSRTWLNDCTFAFHFHALEKEMATHSSVLAWRIPGMGEPGGLPSMGSHRVGHDWSDLAISILMEECFSKVNLIWILAKIFFFKRRRTFQGAGWVLG